MEAKLLLTLSETHSLIGQVWIISSLLCKAHGMTQEKDYMKVTESNQSHILQKDYGNTAIPTYFDITSLKKIVIGMSDYF
jgi:hypothetical protein